MSFSEWRRGVIAGGMSSVSVKKEVQTISFGEIVRGRDASVRVTDDGYLYAVDLVMVMTGADRKYASQVIFV